MLLSLQKKLFSANEKRFTLFNILKKKMILEELSDFDENLESKFIVSGRDTSKMIKIKRRMNDNKN